MHCEKFLSASLCLLEDGNDNDSYAVSLPRDIHDEKVHVHVGIGALF